MEITKLLMDNYLPYSKGVIIGRAIPAIDGLKPSQRRILYTMFRMGLIDGKTTKCIKIAGETSKLHPHGDQSTYDTLVRLSDEHEALNVPYIQGKGNFGKVYSSDTAYAAPRYTEAKLAPICREIFDDIDEDAVDFIDNYDHTTKEPTLLPVKFPTILVNPSSGVAVATSSSIPPFSLKNVCNATIGILREEINTPEELAEVLGVPEFTTGGFVHATKEQLAELCRTGKGTFTVSGHATLYGNRIEITEIPYKAKAEDIIRQIEELAKNGDIKGIAGVNDEIDIKGLKIVVEIKRGYDVQDIARKLFRMTDLRSNISFITRVIINNRCEELGLLDLLKKWIDFRVETVRRIYNYRYNKAVEKEKLLSAWEKIKDDIQGVVDIISRKNDEDIRKELMEKYGLTDEQVDYLLDLRIKDITRNNLKKHLKNLEDLRKSIEEYKEIIEKDELKKDLIIKDLERIRDTYGKENKTRLAPPIVETDEKEEEKIDDSPVQVIITKNGYVKRIANITDINNINVPEGDSIVSRLATRNSEHLLVFTCSGECYKIPVVDIDASRGSFKDKIANILHLPDERQILFVDVSGDYSGYVNIVYDNGKGYRVNYTRVAGKRSKYKSIYEPAEPGTIWATKADKFFIITRRRKAAYCDLTFLGAVSNRMAFRIARVGSGDSVYGIQPIENVPDMSVIDLKKYTKGYCVSIGDDVLWYGAKNNKNK